MGWVDRINKVQHAYLEPRRKQHISVALLAPPRCLKASICGNSFTAPYALGCGLIDQPSLSGRRAAGT